MKTKLAGYMGRLASAALILAALVWPGPAWGTSLWYPTGPGPSPDDLWISSDLDIPGPPGPPIITANGWVWIRDNAKVKVTDSGISAENIALGKYAFGGQLTAINSVVSSNNEFNLYNAILMATNKSKLTAVDWNIELSQLTVTGESEITAGYDIVFNVGSQITVDGSKINAGGDIDIYRDSQLRATGGSELTAGYDIGIGSHAQLTALGSKISAKKIYVDFDSQLTATGGSEITADSFAVFDASTLTLKDGASLTTTGKQSDHWSFPQENPIYHFYGDFEAGLAVYSLPAVKRYSLVRIDGPDVTIDNKFGAAFFNGSTLEVGKYELKVKGGLTFLNGSTYSLERTDSSIGLTKVTDGQVTIYPGANLLITSGAEEDINDQNKTFLTATGGVNLLGGSGFRNVLYTFDYSPTSVSLAGRKSEETFKDDLGGAFGHRWTNNYNRGGNLIYNILAGHSQSWGGLRERLEQSLNRIYDADDPAQAEKAYKQLIGEGALHTVNAHHNNVSQVAATLGGRFQTLLTGHPPAAGNGSAENLGREWGQADLKLPPSAGNGPTENRLWLKPFGQWNRQEDDNDVLGYSYNSGGLTLGYDREMALPGLTLGLYGSLARGDLENDLSETHLRTAGLGLYGLYEFGPYFVDLDLGFSRSDNHATISLSDLLGGGQKTSDFHGDSFQTGLNFGRAFQVAETATLTPSAGLRYTRVKQKGWTEKVVSPDPENTLPANWFADSRQNFVEIPLNLKLASTFETTHGATVSPELRLGGIIAANHPKSEFRMGFVGSNDSAIISGIAPGRSRLVAGAGLKAQLSEATDVFLNYDLEARSGYQGHSASAGIGISF